VSLLAQAQAKAAREGRSVGVTYSEVSTWTDVNNNGIRDAGEPVQGNGMALEASIIAEPPAFTGFSSDSACGFVYQQGDDYFFYAPLSAAGLTLARAILPGDPPIVNLVFGEGVGGEGLDFLLNPNPEDVTHGLPPETFRGAVMRVNDDGIPYVDGNGDVIQIGKELFEILVNDCDDFEDTDNDPDVDPLLGPDVGTPPALGATTGQEYLLPQRVVTVRWLTWRGRQPQAIDPLSVAPGDPEQSLLPRGGRAYRIRRQPTTTESPSRTTAEAVQFPRNVGIDLDPDRGNRSFSIVFAPNGTVEALYRDGQKENDVFPVFIMLGRVENANDPEAPELEYLARYDFRNPADIFDEDLAERRTQVNLLNGDSRWVVVTPAGRILAAENALFDPRTLRNPDGELFLDTLTGDEDDQLDKQRDRWRFEAQRFARNYDAESGG
jgi:hypothetical protein